MLLIAAIAANIFLSTFAGTWSCAAHVPGVAGAPSSVWTIGSVPHSGWATVSWSTRSEGGTSFVGYVALEKQWLYEDFRSDGSFSAYSAPPPANGVWTWQGTYTNAQRTVHGASQWSRIGNGFKQSFGRMVGPSFRETAYAQCVPVKR